MTTSTHGGAVNFHSYIDSGVDPATGTYSANILLATLTEPDYPIRLVYSPLNLKNMGFGQGWRIPVSVYNEKKKLLSLSDGRLYQIDDNLEVSGSTGDVTFEEEKDFGYRVTFRNTGIIELLKKGETDNCMCIASYSSIGAGLYFEWEQNKADKTVKLTSVHKIISDKKVEQLAISYEENAVTIVVWPNLPAKRTFKLTLENEQLTNIENQTFTPSLNWLLTYDSKLKSIRNPSGHNESVTFDKNGKVDRHYTDFGTTHLTYGKFWTAKAQYADLNGSATITLHRYLGAHTEIGRYEYFVPDMSIALSLINGDNLWLGHFEGLYPQKKIHFSRNNFNLITKETHRQGDTDLLKLTWKYDKHGRITETTENKKKNIYTYQFDDRKSLLISNATHTPNTSKPEVFTFKQYTYISFKSKKNPLCKSLENTEVPLIHYELSGQSENGTATLYEVNEAAYLSKPESADYLTLSTLSTYLATGGISYSNPKFDASVNENFVKKFITDNVTTGELVKSETDVKVTSSTDGLRLATKTFKTSDGAILVSKTLTDPNSGDIHREDDVKSNVSKYSWDGLGRLIKTVNNPGTSFETTETFEHGIATNKIKEAILGKDKAKQACFTGYIIHTDTAGSKTLVGHDPSGREVQVWECIEQSSSKHEWFLLKDKEFKGKTIRKQSDTDYYNGTQKTSISTQLGLEPKYRLDVKRATTDKNIDIIATIADEENSTITKLYFNTNQTFDEDEFKETYSLDDIPELTLTNNTLSSVSIAPLTFDATSGIGWCTRETLDDDGNVIKLERYSLRIAESNSSTLTCSLHSTSTQTYNEYNKRASVTDELGHTTRFEYDFFGRHTKTTLADGCIITKTYTPYSDKELFTEIKLTKGEQQTVLGKQTYDSLDRLLSSTSTGSQTFTYDANKLTPATLKTGTGTLKYESICELGDAIKSINGKTLSQTFSYESGTGLLSGFEDETGLKSTLNYGVHAKIAKEVITPIKGGTTKEQTRTFSPGGKCLEYTDTAGKKQTFTYDANGNVTEVDDPATKVTAVYGAFGRLISQKILNKKAKKHMDITFTYSPFGEEIKRTVVPDDDTTKSIQVEQTFHKNRQLATRKITKGKATLRNETFTYNSRNLLTQYTCSGSELPLDGYKKAISKLELSYDALANITQCITHFDKDKDTATFHYDNTSAPCQLSKVTHTHKDYTATVNLTYDANGCLTKNEKGQTLSYDELNRLKSLKEGNDTYLYHYDPQGRLRSRSKLTDRTDWYYQLGAVFPVRTSECKGTLTTRITRLAGQIAALTNTKEDKDESTRLITCERMGTPLVDYDGTDISVIKCTPFGVCDAPLAVGWSGELYDEVAGTYHLGERQYSPTLMRFTTPDSWSPFGEGGINDYAYVDPVNCPDPDGHISAWGIVGLAAAVVFGVIVGIATMGAGLAAISAAGASVASVMLVAGGASLIASGAVAIAAELVRDNNPETARKLDWIAFGLGVVGTVMTLGAGFARGAAETSMQGVRSSAPRIGPMAKYAVRAQTMTVELEPLGSISEAGQMAMQTEFVGGSRFAFSTASNFVQGVQSVGSTVALEMIARLAANARFRMVGYTMGMEALLGFGIAAKHHYEREQR